MKTLSLCMIVKNEINNLKELLPQIKDLADEIIIVDTGSNDGTYEYLKNIDFIKLLKFKWVNDFSKARNFSIQQATKNFILWLDADDRIIFKKNFKNRLDENHVYFLKVKNSSDNTFFYQLRIFPNFKNIKFKGKVHEQVEFEKNKFKINFLNEVEIIHTGYENRELLVKKHKRNIDILNSIKEKDFYDILQLAESYKIIGNFEKSFEYLKKVLDFKDLPEKNIEIYCFIHFEIYRIEKLLNFDYPEKWLFKVENKGDKFPVIFYYLGRYFYKNKDYKKSKEYFEKFLKHHKSFRYLNPVPEKIEESCFYFLAKTEINLKNKNKAKKIIERLINISPDNKSYLSLKRLL